MWSEKTVVDQRREFTWFASQEGANMTELCRRYEVSRTTGYEWLARFVREGPPGLVDRSRRPHHSPRRTPEAMEGRVLALRDAHPHWGGRKLRRLLLNEGVDGVPAPSTITRVLERHGRLDGEAGGGRSPWQRFEHEAPNDLWQMDFKGPLRLLKGTAHILTVLDDHSRFLVLLEGCADQRGTTVQEALTGAFRQYGLPARILTDNGSPWGSDRDHPYTPLTVWLLRLGVGVSHGRPYHPQTQGKAERFHGTLEVELLRGRGSTTSPACGRPCSTGEASTTGSGRTWRWSWPRRAAATSRALGAFPSGCRLSSTAPTTRSGGCSSMVSSTSAVGSTGWAKPSGATRSPCVPCSLMATTPCISVITKSRPSTALGTTSDHRKTTSLACALGAQV